MSQWSRSRWHDPATPRGIPSAASRFVVTATALRTVARAFRSAGVSGFFAVSASGEATHAPAGDARRRVASRVLLRRKADSLRVNVAAARCRNFRSFNVERETRGVSWSTLPESRGISIAWRVTPAPAESTSFAFHPVVEPDTSPLIRVVWRETGETWAQRAATICARDGKGVVNITTRATRTFLDVSVSAFGFRLNADPLVLESD